MSDRNENNRYKNVDFFAQIACGGNKRLVTRIPRMKEIEPIELNRIVLAESGKKDIKMPVFDEKKEYDNFIEEKKKLREYYAPFTAEYQRKVISPSKSERLVDFSYRKETDEDKKDFSLVLTGKGEWEKVSLPHYVGPEGIWNAFYRTIINISGKDAESEYLIDFEAVDYIAEVYLNGRLITRHEGFFAPFTAVLTPQLREGENVLVVVVKNDVTTTGAQLDGVEHYGKKIYANTHIGYNEPELGWHHCPAGAGIFGNVTLVKCRKQRITDIFVETDTDNSKIKIHTKFYNFVKGVADCEIRYTVEGRNFKQTIFENIEGKISRTLTEDNFLEEEFDLPDFKFWTQKTPYLYAVTVTLVDGNGNTIDEKQTHFGMRKFVSDENSVPKGKFYLNGERIILRGANEMGHFPNAVMRGDFDSVIDDILTAKVAGLNFYRFTQRPVFDVLYTYFDMFGMLCQSDFPAFLFLRESVLGEAYKQVDEMELLTRNHPCVVIESFCNETADSEDYHWEQYGMGRKQMEMFFETARRIVLQRNPQRVVKYCDGDYSPLKKSYGVNDFHCYTYWYNAHGVLPGKFEKGYLPPFRSEWMAGCGEYGTDGLDSLELMKKYYPKEWLPKTDDEPWTPKRIARAQCFGMHSDFFPEQTNIKDWIKISREYQREATKLYVHSLRRRADYVQSTAVHLLIDAWPGGWTKTLVDYDKIPKPAYYAFKEANIATRVSIRTGKKVAYNDENINVEVYALNDLAQSVKAEVAASVYFDDELKFTYAKRATASEVSCEYLGDVVVKPQGFVGTIKVVSEMVANGITTYDEAVVETKPRSAKAKKAPVIYGDKLACIKEVCENADDVDGKVIFCDNEQYRLKQNELEKQVLDGARVVIFTDKSLNVFNDDILFKIHVIAEEIGTCRTAWHSETNEMVKEFPLTAFRDFYNADKDYYDLASWFKFDWDGSEEILYTMVDESADKYVLHKKHKNIMAVKKFGKGEVVLTTLTALKGCIGHNPYLDKLIINLIEK